MNPESTPIKVDTEYGPLYLAVMPSKEYRTYDIEQECDVTQRYPRIRVATDITFEADPAADDHWTIRRRAYALHKAYRFQDLTHIAYDNGSPGDRWHREENPRRGGHRSDKRQPLEFRTATYAQMERAVIDALDVFAADRPEWAQVSEFLYLSRRSDAAYAEAQALEAQLAEKVGETMEFTRQANAVGQDLPDWHAYALSTTATTAPPAV